MKKFIYVIALFTSVMQAQVGIGTSTPNGALDINSALPPPSPHKAGLMPPNVALRATDLVATTNSGSNVINPNGGGNPLPGTLVYNTATSAPGPNQVTPGYYYYNGTIWEKMATSGQSSATYFSTGGVSINSGTGLTYATGFPVTVNVPANCEVLITCNIGLQTAAGAGNNAFSITDVLLIVDGAPLTNSGYQRIYMTNNNGVGFNVRYATFNQALTLTPGTHTFGVAAGGAGLGGSPATFGGNDSSVLQGELTVSIIKK